MKIISLALIFLSLFVFPLSSSGFTLEDQYYSDLTDTTYYTYLHDDTGFKVVYANSEIGDKYVSLSFRTPLINNGDLTHVFEHTLLSGSEKYPSTALFSDIEAGTFVTNGNGSTTASYTKYYLSTPSEMQLFKYTDALLSLVDSPLLLVDENIYKREAVRYDLFDSEDEIRPAGTVFVEDMGYINSMTNSVIFASSGELYPNSNAIYSIGRLPENLKDNTYDSVTKLFGEYYNWDNALLYISGKVDIEALLDSIERDHLLKYEKQKTFDLVKERFEIKPESGYREKVYEVPASLDTRVTDTSTYLVYAFDIGDFSLSEIKALDELFPLIKSSLFYEEAAKSGYGNLTMYYSSTTLRPFLFFLLPYTSQDKKDGFKETVERIITRLSDGYYDQDQIDSLLSQYERNLSTISAEGMAGDYYESDYIMNFIRFDERDAARECEAVHNLLYEEGEKILKEVFSHLQEEDRARVLLTLTPNPGGYEEIIEGIENYMAQMKENMSDEEISELIKETEDFYKWAEEIDVNYSVAIDREMAPFSSIDKVSYSTSLNGINGDVVLLDDDRLCLLEINFNISDLLQEDKNLFMLYAYTLFRESEDYELFELREKLNDLFYSRNLTFSVKNEEPVISINVTFERDKVKDALSLFYSLLFNPYHTKEYMHNIMPGLVESVNPRHYSINEYSGSFGSDYYKFMFSVKTEELYEYFSTVLENIGDDEYFAMLNDSLCKMNDSLLQKDRISFTLYSSESVLEEVIASSAPFIDDLNRDGMKEEKYPLLPDIEGGIAFINNNATANLYYVLKISDAEEIKGSYLPYLLFFAEKCMRPLRASGSAYGYEANAYPDLNLIMMATYTDSNPQRSIEVMENGWEKLKEIPISEEELNAFSLNMLASYQMPYSELSNKIEKYALLRFFSQRDAEDLINGSQDSLLSEKDEAIAIFSKAFSEHGVLFYQGPENLLSPIRDRFSIVVDCR